MNGGREESCGGVQPASEMKERKNVNQLGLKKKKSKTVDFIMAGFDESVEKR